ncbi:protein of unknown function [Pseudodesulfovibrio piezophilus C1TLV30]|uniref:Uncharacterized protein n=1 Tax=Pseudodesulfovibrio piezophilus (strain DSM 21447 / JCM 15486 / C1TLV30) TaxID=1322246 RepID=M1WWX9_PSEP2|nr:protein of unknown function [Pseudodesulfovibrio piezophilus C1TLV30]
MVDVIHSHSMRKSDQGRFSCTVEETGVRYDFENEFEYIRWLVATHRLWHVQCHGSDHLCTKK